jgi:hypothetical protein
MMNRRMSAISDPSDPTSAILDTGNAAVERQRQGITNQHGENGDILGQWGRPALFDVRRQTAYNFQRHAKSTASTMTFGS